MTSTRPPVDDAGTPHPVPTATLQLELARVASGTVVLSVAGEIDIASCEEFASTLHAAVEAGAGADRVVVDLRRVGFLGACGLTALLDAHHDARLRGGHVRVVFDDAAPAARAMMFLPASAGLTIAPTLTTAVAGPVADPAAETETGTGTPVPPVTTGA